jgi:uncharacterized protein YkwD
MAFSHVAALVLLCLALVACDSMGMDVPPEPEAGVEPWGEMLEAINDVRAQGATCGDDRMAPAPPVIWDSRLERAATTHARDMAENGFFGHTSSDGTRMGDRVRRAGYDWAVVGENLARYQRSVGEVVTDWVESPGHCRQLLAPSFREVGVALVDGHWAQVFGVPR